jgi:hypothetical protein
VANTEAIALLSERRNVVIRVGAMPLGVLLFAVLDVAHLLGDV